MKGAPLPLIIRSNAALILHDMQNNFIKQSWSKVIDATRMWLRRRTRGTTLKAQTRNSRSFFNRPKGFIGNEDNRYETEISHRSDCLPFLLSSSALAQPTKLNVGYSAISAEQLPAWIAKETGIFKKMVWISS
jgi:hypothetical protein